MRVEQLFPFHNTFLISHLMFCFGLYYTDQGDIRQGTVGYSIARQHQGQGYATEALGALLRFAFSELKMHRVVASLDPRNAPSYRVLERLGMRREGHLVLSYWDETTQEWTDEYIYALLCDEWTRIHDEACLKIGSG